VHRHRQKIPLKHGNAFRYALIDGKRVLSDRAIRRRHGSHAAARAAGATTARVPARIAWLWVFDRHLLHQHKPLPGNPALTDPPGIPGQQRELEAAHGRAYRAPQVLGI
jgi:hypothetical protein